MAFSNNIISFDGNKALEPRFTLREEHRSVVQSCRELVLKNIPKLGGEMFEKLDDALYELADKADNNHLRTAHFDAMREVRKEREKIESHFIGGILAGYDNFWQNGPTNQRAASSVRDLDSDEFSLVEEADLEEGLAVSNMISRGENHYYRDLYALDQRFGSLAGGVQVDRISNPLAPAAICNSFHESIRGLSLDISVTLVIYKNFEHFVVDALGGFYQELNRQLADAGVLPKLTRKVRRSKTYIAPNTTATSTGDAGIGNAGYEQDDEVAGLQAEVFSTLQQLLLQRRAPISPAAAVHQASLPVVDTSELVSALSLLQQRDTAAVYEEGYQSLPVVDLRSNLKRAVQLGEGDDADRKIGQNDEDAIDVISMLFEFILEDRNLPDAMKALLARLQIPMLKVAILDKTFFSKKQHPARRLLNNLAQAAVGWSESSGRDEGGLYTRIESIVERILTGFENNVDTFVELNDEFTEFLEKEQRGSQVTEERAAQVTLGKEQLQVARHEVFQQINNRLLGRDDIPQVVLTLIREGWKDVLLLTYLRKGNDGPEWQRALKLMDRLLWSVEAKPEKSQRQELLKEIPVLLKSLRTGLNGISYDQHKMARLFKELQSCHVDSLKGKGCRPAGDNAGTREVPSVAEPATAGAAEQPPAQDNTQAAITEEIVLQSPAIGEVADPSQRDEHLETAEQLPIGTWLDVTNEEDDTYRAKLSWRSKVSGTCLFVNRKGMKVAEVSVQGLATWFRSGKAVVLDEVSVPLMDRALKAMVQVLKNTGDT